MIRRTIKRNKCLINGKEFYYDLMQSHNSNELYGFEYLGYGKVIKIKEETVKSISSFFEGHFWRRKDIPKEQDYRYLD